MKKFHITITENETGKALVDTDTDAIVAGIDENEETHVVHAAHCPVATHAATITGVLEEIKEAREKNPMLDLLLMLYEKHKDADEEIEEN